METTIDQPVDGSREYLYQDYLVQGQFCVACKQIPRERMFQSAYDDRRLNWFDSNFYRDRPFALIPIGEDHTECPLCLIIRDCIRSSGLHMDHVVLQLEFGMLRLGQFTNTNIDISLFTL